MSQISNVFTDYAYTIQYIDNNEKVVTSNLITNLKYNDDIEQMKSNLSWLVGRDVIGFQLS